MGSRLSAENKKIQQQDDKLAKSLMTFYDESNPYDTNESLYKLLTFNLYSNELQSVNGFYLPILCDKPIIDDKIKLLINFGEQGSGHKINVRANRLYNYGNEQNHVEYLLEESITRIEYLLSNSNATYKNAILNLGDKKITKRYINVICRFVRNVTETVVLANCKDLSYKQLSKIMNASSHWISFYLENVDLTGHASDLKFTDKTKLAFQELKYLKSTKSYPRAKKFVERLNEIDNLKLKLVELDKGIYKDLVREGYNNKFRFVFKYKRPVPKYAQKKHKFP